MHENDMCQKLECFVSF